MSLFKRKKKKEEYVEPIKPKPRVLKTFKDYRIVLGSRTIMQVCVPTGETPKVERYDNKLVIEKKDTNAMEEPFYKLYKEDYRWIYEDLTVYTLKPSGYESDKLLFELIEEMFLND